MIARVRNRVDTISPFILAPIQTDVLSKKCDNCGAKIRPNNWHTVKDCGDDVLVCGGCVTKDYRAGRTIKVGFADSGWVVMVDGDWDGASYPTRDKARKAAKSC